MTKRRRRVRRFDCPHDWVLRDDQWWHCAHCETKMHPSWTPESRRRFEAGIAILRLQMTKPDEIVRKISEGSVDV